MFTFDLKPSPIDGVGLFTLGEIKAGSVLFPIEGKLVRTDELTDDFIRQGIMQGVAPGLAIVSKDGVRNFFSYMNHSCESNCAVDIEHLHVFALRDIMAEEELTLNYDAEPCDCRVRRLVNEVLGRKSDGPR